MVSEMRRCEIEQIFKKYGWYHSIENPYTFVNFNSGHFASLGCPRNMGIRSESVVGWIVHVWDKCNYNGISYYNYIELLKRLEMWPPFGRIK